MIPERVTMAEVSTQVPHWIHGGRCVESNTFCWGLGLYHYSFLYQHTKLKLSQSQRSDSSEQSDEMTRFPLSRMKQTLGSLGNRDPLSIM